MKAEKFNRFVQSFILEADFRELGFEFAENDRFTLHRGFVLGDHRGGRDDNENGGDD